MPLLGKASLPAVHSTSAAGKPTLRRGSSALQRHSASPSVVALACRGQGGAHHASPALAPALAVPDRLGGLEESIGGSVDDHHDLFQGLKMSSALPERAQAYLALLAESTTSQGSMQKHLLHLAANAATQVSNAAGLVSTAAGVIINPMDCLAQALAEAGAGSVTAEVRRRTGRQSWAKLRNAVLGAALFKSAGRQAAKDDSCLSDSSDAPLLNPIQAKFLQLCLGSIMSNASLAALHSVGVTPDVVHHLLPQAADAVVHLVHAGGSVAKEGTQHLANVGLSGQHMHAALTAHVTNVVGGAQGPQEVVDINHSGLGLDNVAAATATRLLRADSKSRAILTEVGGELKTADYFLGTFHAMVETATTGMEGGSGGSHAAQLAQHGGGAAGHVPGLPGAYRG